MLAGASDPPTNIETSTRRPRDSKGGRFLKGVTADLKAMEKHPLVANSIYNTVRDFYLEKEEARTKIKKLFRICKRAGHKPVIYYTEHGEIRTGNWCFDDGTLSIGELQCAIPDGCENPLIISDAATAGTGRTTAGRVMRMDLSAWQLPQTCPLQMMLLG